MSDDSLKLQNQICYRLYLASNGIMRLYKPLLAPLGLTYPQYILMLSLWEKDQISMGELATTTSMDKGFLSTLIRGLLEKSLIQVLSDPEDHRRKIVALSRKGEKLKDKARDIPRTLVCMLMKEEKNPEEVELLKSLLDELNQTLATL